MTEKTLNNANVRVYGSMFDAIWWAPLTAEFPVIETVEDLLKDFPEPWVNIGWLNEDGIPLQVSANIEEMNGHQGGTMLRTKVTQTKKGFQIGALEEAPQVTSLFFDHGTPVAHGTGLARVELPKGIGTVAGKSMIITADDDIVKVVRSTRTEIGEREDVSHTNSAISGYTMSAAMVGETDIITNAESYVSIATPAPAGP